MDNYKIRNIAVRATRFSLSFDNFINIDDKYILGNGILINKNGNVIWDNPWRHSFDRWIYVKKHNLLITNRLSRVRCLCQGAGLACISLDTGKYSWFHFYRRALDEKYAVESKLKDINLEKTIKFVDVKEEFLYTRNFKINILSGDYECIENPRYREKILISDSNKYLKLITKHQFYAKRPLVKFGVNSVQIDETLIKKTGYSFKKCNVVVDKSPYLYFFATPEENNENINKGIIIFKYSRIEKSIVRELELPFGGDIVGVYDFFDNGIMIHEEVKKMSKEHNSYNLWLILQM